MGGYQMRRPAWGRREAEDTKATSPLPCGRTHGLTLSSALLSLSSSPPALLPYSSLSFLAPGPIILVRALKPASPSLVSSSYLTAGLS